MAGTNGWDQLGAETLRGCLVLTQPASVGWADEDEQRPIDILWRRQRGVNRVEEARERRSGEISIKASARNPGREKPKGATSGSRAKHTWVVRDSWKGQSPETAARQAGPCTSVQGYTDE